MSNLRYTIKKSGRLNRDLDITEFLGSVEKGVMLQLTQGLPLLSGNNPDEPGFIQLTKNDAKQLVKQLEIWIKEY